MMTSDDLLCVVALSAIRDYTRDEDAPYVFSFVVHHENETSILRVCSCTPWCASDTRDTEIQEIQEIEMHGIY